MIKIHADKLPAEPQLSSLLRN